MVSQALRESIRALYDFCCGFGRINHEQAVRKYVVGAERLIEAE